MTLRPRSLVATVLAAAALGLGAGTAAADEPPTYGPEWSPSAPGTGPE